jgi:hypothetical protein
LQSKKERDEEKHRKGEGENEEDLKKWGFAFF